MIIIKSLLICLLFLFATSCSSVQSPGRYGYKGKVDKFSDPIVVNPIIPKIIKTKEVISFNIDKIKQKIEFSSNVLISEKSKDIYELKSSSDFIDYSCEFSNRGEILHSNVNSNNITKILNSKLVDDDTEEFIENLFSDKNKVCKSYQYLFRTRKFIYGLDLKDYEDVLLDASNASENITYGQLLKMAKIYNVALGVVDHNGSRNMLHGHYLKVPVNDEVNNVTIDNVISGYYLTDLETGLRTINNIYFKYYYQGNLIGSVTLENELISYE